MALLFIRDNEQHMDKVYVCKVTIRICGGDGEHGPTNERKVNNKNLIKIAQCVGGVGGGAIWTPRSLFE